MFQIIRKWVKGLFPVKDIQTALNIRLAISDEMLHQIAYWDKCWRGTAPWLEEDMQSLHLEQSVVSEFANTAVNEMTAAVNHKMLDSFFQEAVSRLSEELPAGLASGAMVIKPLGPYGGVQFVPQSQFLPEEYDSRKRLKKVIFPEFRKIGDVYYTRLERHVLDANGLTITNTAYRSHSEGILGREISLSAVDDWAALPPLIRYPDMHKPAFGYYRNPKANTVDLSGAGISIFQPAIETIAKADMQFGRIDWEYESAERAIHADAQALRLTSSGGFRMPHRKKRLYRGLELQAGNNGELFQEFSPQLRGDDFLNGLNAYKREIEFQVGLAYGDISNPQSVEKTATEILASRQRKYNTVGAIQKELKGCLTELVDALAFYHSMMGAGASLSIAYKDSILTDEEAERRQDAQDVAMGAMQLWEYRMKWYGEDETTARKMVRTDFEEEI